MFDSYRGAIDPNKQVYSPSRQATGGYNPYAKYGAGQSFEENYTPMAVASANEASRNATQAQNAYYNKAADIQTRGALQGLGLLGQQRSNAYDRQNTMQDMQYKWMNDIMGSGSGLLGGLL